MRKSHISTVLTQTGVDPEVDRGAWRARVCGWGDKETCHAYFCWWWWCVVFSLMSGGKLSAKVQINGTCGMMHLAC